MIKLITIDPGRSGAIAYQHDDGKVTVVKMPDTNEGIYFELKEARENATPDVYCILERVGAMPHDGRSSLWKFAEHFGYLKCSLTSNNIPFILVTQQSWMKKLGSLPKDKKQRKNAIKSLAQQAFPDIRVTLWNGDALGMMRIYRQL